MNEDLKIKGNWRRKRRKKTKKKQRANQFKFKLNAVWRYDDVRQRQVFSKKENFRIFHFAFVRLPLDAQTHTPNEKRKKKKTENEKKIEEFIRTKQQNRDDGQKIKISAERELKIKFVNSRPPTTYSFSEFIRLCNASNVCSLYVQQQHHTLICQIAAHFCDTVNLVWL